MGHHARLRRCFIGSKLRIHMRGTFVILEITNIHSQAMEASQMPYK
jgi:hypothetical protein